MVVKKSDVDATKRRRKARRAAVRKAKAAKVIELEVVKVQPEASEAPEACMELVTPESPTPDAGSQAGKAEETVCPEPPSLPQAPSGARPKRVSKKRLAKTELLEHLRGNCWIYLIRRTTTCSCELSSLLNLS